MGKFNVAKDFQHAAKMAGEILEESKNSKSKLEVSIFASFDADGVECVPIHSHWMEGIRSITRMMYVKDDGTAPKVVAVLNGQTAEPIQRVGENLSSFHDAQPVERFTRELF